MNYLYKYSDLLILAGYFCSKFNYEFESGSGKVEGMGCAYIVLKNKNLPNIRIDMEKYILCIFLIISEGKSINLDLYYKYRNPHIILHGKNFYKKKKNFNQYFYTDYLTYLESFISDKNFNYQDMESFYKKFPPNVWKWIEK